MQLFPETPCGKHLQNSAFVEMTIDKFYKSVTVKYIYKIHVRYITVAVL
jgi:hypothetical protein